MARILGICNILIPHGNGGNSIKPQIEILSGSDNSADKEGGTVRTSMATVD